MKFETKFKKARAKKGITPIKEEKTTYKRKTDGKVIPARRITFSDNRVYMATASRFFREE